MHSEYAAALTKFIAPSSFIVIVRQAGVTAAPAAWQEQFAAVTRSPRVELVAIAVQLPIVRTLWLTLECDRNGVTSLRGNFYLMAALSLQSLCQFAESSIVSNRY